jgi:hypothetical protein
MFACPPLSQTTQAGYLRRAYRYAARYPQVAALLWYLRSDESPTGLSSDSDGVYTGLRTVTGAPKRSWYAFAGGNRLTLNAPRAVLRGHAAVLRGTLTCSRLGASTVSGTKLALQRRVAGHWRTLRTIRTLGAGAYQRRAYVAHVRPASSSRYRLVWTGVISSPARRVLVR